MDISQEHGGSEAEWLLLAHRLPAKPAYARVRIWRRLAEIGAVAVKSGVYVLPANSETQEDLEWLLREVEESGGEGMICVARFVDGISDAELRALFDAARDSDYDALAADIGAVPERLEEAQRGEMAVRLKRWRKRLAEIAAIDFFGALGRRRVEELLASWEARMTRSKAAPSPQAIARDARAALRRRVWVTRQGVKVDRIACAWLIRRFIDPDATFKFVAGKGYAPLSNELRFDMFEAEFSHVGDRCSFEVLTAQAAPGDAALTAIGEIVHDIDLKDGKFGRAETPGVAALIDGIAAATDEDDERVARGGALFDQLYAGLRAAPASRAR